MVAWKQSRRGLLGSLALAGGVAAVGGARCPALDPLRPAGEPRLRLGLSAYGFRRFFRWSRGREQQPPAGSQPLELEGFVDLAADLGCDAVELTSYFFPPAADDAWFAALRRRVFLRGIGISGVAVGNNFARGRGAALDAEVTEVNRWIDRTALLGAPHLRVFAGPVPKDLPAAEARAGCVEALAECAGHASGRGVMLGLENHGGLAATAEAVLDLVAAVDSPWLGVNLDTGNFRTADPYAAVARCVPWAVNVQYKTEIQRQPQGPKEPADPRRVVQILRQGNYQGTVVLEYEAAEDPFTAVPRHLAELRPLLG